MNSKSLPIDDLARIERLAYFKAWRAANKDKVRRHNENYWRKRAEKQLKGGGIQHDIGENANGQTTT